jgi:hypothetical protein
MPSSHEHVPYKRIEFRKTEACRQARPDPAERFSQLNLTVEGGCETHVVTGKQYERPSIIVKMYGDFQHIVFERDEILVDRGARNNADTDFDAGVDACDFVYVGIWKPGVFFWAIRLRPGYQLSKC